MLNGFMLPNYEWQDWTTEQLAQTIALNPTVLLIPLYENTNPFSAQKRLDIGRLRSGLPGCEFLYRIMGQNNMLRDPKVWAAESKARVSGLPPGAILPTNEDNLEGMGELWDAMVVWWRSYMAEMYGHEVHLCALAPTGNYRSGWNHLASIAGMFSAVNIHVYPGNEIDVHDALAYFGDRRIYVTEYNRIMPTSMYAEAQQAGTRGIVWFILDGTPDQHQYALVEPYLSDYKKIGGSMPTTLRKYSHGADISNNNGSITDRDQLARCIDFIEVKAWEGLTSPYPDQYFKANWQFAHDYGLVPIAYDFARPSEGSGHDEAMRFLDYVSANGGINKGDIPMLDMEDRRVGAGADLLAYALDWLQTVEAAWGCAPMLYSADWYMKPHNLEGHTELARYGLNYAAYGTTSPIVPAPWTFWTIWQYTDRGSLPGLVQAVDLDLFNGTVDQLRKYGKP